MRKLIRIKKSILLTLLAISCVLSEAYSQSKIVTGSVKDEQGKSLADVTVVVQNKKIGVTTGIDGKFTINALTTDKLVFSYIGMKEQEIVVVMKLQIDIILKEDAKLLFVSTEWRPVIELIFTKPRGGDPLPNKRIVVEEFIGIKGFKALGNQLTQDKLKEVVLAESLPYEDAEQEPLDDVEVVDPNQLKDSNDDESQIKLEL